MSWVYLRGYDGERDKPRTLIRSGDYGITVFSVRQVTYPARDLEMVSVPGRNGDLTLDNGRFRNVRFEFWMLATPVTSGGDTYTGWTQAEKFINAVSALRGYIEIETSWHTGLTRFGVLDEGATAIVSEGLHHGFDCKFKLVFNCKPQQYWPSGFDSIEIPVGGSVTLQNPTRFQARPVLKYSAPGRIVLNKDPYPSLTVLSGATFPLEIDCEAMDAYSGRANMNKFIRMNQNLTDWMPIPPGQTEIVNETSDIAWITPRWWQL